ncbi:MAG: hypothetical protein ACRDTF_02285, partial [Pseudonocardiaceae bacterium]
TGHYFYMLADGNAVNFLHGASVGTFIFLVQAEILAALASLAAAGHEPGMHELDRLPVRSSRPRGCATSMGPHEHHHR